jgi:hypothetical protein
MDAEQRPRAGDTQEFLTLWNAAKEEHFALELAPLLPLLLGSPGNLDPGYTTDAARHIVRALHLASTVEEGVAAGVDYLAKVVE